MKTGTETALCGTVELGVDCWLTRSNHIAVKLQVAAGEERRTVEAYRRSVTPDELCSIRLSMLKSIEARVYDGFVKKELPRLSTVDALYQGSPCVERVRREMSKLIREVLQGEI